MFYAILIGTSMLLSIGAALAVHFVTGTISLVHAFLMPLAVALYCALLLGIIDVIIRLLPRKIWQFDKGSFRVSKKEARFYEKLGIKKWKDKAVPELGKTAGFSKKNLQGTEIEYLSKFLMETCMGETLHLIGAVVAFTALAVFPAQDWYFVLFIVIINFFINILPCMIQRYNRYRLGVVYKFKTRKQTLHAATPCFENEEDDSTQDNSQNSTV